MEPSGALLLIFYMLIHSFGPMLILLDIIKLILMPDFFEARPKHHTGARPQWKVTGETRHTLVSRTVQPI